MPLTRYTADDIIKGYAPDSYINSTYAGEGTAKQARLYLKQGNKSLTTLIRDMSATGGASIRPYINAISEIGFMGFILVRAIEPMDELYTVKEMQGDSYVAKWRGSRPPIFSYEAILLETDLCPWKTIFQKLYVYCMRGSQAAKNDITVNLVYGSSSVSGQFLSAAFDMNAELQMAPNCSFKMLVKNFEWVEPGYNPITEELNIAPEPTTAAEGSGATTLLTGGV